MLEPEGALKELDETAGRLEQTHREFADARADREDLEVSAGKEERVHRKIAAKTTNIHTSAGGA